MRIARVALDLKKYSLDNFYDYLIPAEFDTFARRGARIVAPFGNGNKKTQGIIFDILESSSFDKLKAISDILDSDLVVDEITLSMAEFMKNRYFCTYFDALKTILPAGIRYDIANTLAVLPSVNEIDFTPSEQKILDIVKSKKNLTIPELENLIGTNTKKDIRALEEKRALCILTKNIGLSPETLRQTATLLADSDILDDYFKIPANHKHEPVVEMLRNGGDTSVPELCYYGGVSRSVISTLQKRGIIAVYLKSEDCSAYKVKIPDELDRSEIVLSDEQEIVFDSLSKNMWQKQPKTTLLHGITGSGKTLIYLNLVENLLVQKKGAIILVPEIVLTPQLTDRFFSRFGEKVAVLHSRLSATERRDAWKKIKSGECPLVLGTRSAIFAPVKELALIVIDEEHEYAYKSENTPRYHARTIARFRAKNENALLLLCSATPSIESYALAKRGSYEHLRLTSRYNESGLPDVIVTNLKDELYCGESSITGPTLINAIKETISEQKQAILFLNRRGYSTFISCKDCGYVVECESCSVSMTYHSANNRLMCHICGRTIHLPELCPSCKTGAIIKRGIGTQKVEEEIIRLFPEAKVLRMDMDTTSTKMSHEEMLLKFAAGEYNILIGTQMVTKGIDMPNVKLVGVLFADSLLFQDDFRAGERAFSLLTQVVGRAGRADIRGEAIIETFVPENKIIEMAKNQDYISFFEQELAFRRMAIFPPFCDIYQINFVSSEEKLVKEAAQFFETNLKTALEAAKLKNIILFPASEAPLYRANEKFRFRMVLKCKDDETLRNVLRTSLLSLQKHKNHGKVTCSIDINPY